LVRPRRRPSRPGGRARDELGAGNIAPLQLPLDVSRGDELLPPGKWQPPLFINVSPAAVVAPDWFFLRLSFLIGQISAAASSSWRPFSAHFSKKNWLENQILVLIPNLFYPIIPCIVHTNVNN
jgi:hypothetical protein